MKKTVGSGGRSVKYQPPIKRWECPSTLDFGHEPQAPSKRIVEHSFLEPLAQFQNGF